MYKKYLLLLLVTLSLVGCNDNGEDSNSSSYTPPPIAGDGGNIGSGTTTTGTGTGNFTLSGRIAVTNNTVKDNDVNDPNASRASNNTINEAQAIPNPVILGGYVNQPGAGSNGSSKTSGDVNDFFMTDLKTGQTISLFVANQDLIGNDLDLALLDGNGNILNASVGDGSTESLRVPKNGRYFIQVQAYTGASNYVLSIGQDISVSNAAPNDLLTLDQEFAPGEIILEFKQTDTLHRLSNELGMQTQSQDTTRRMLYTLDLNQPRILSATNNLQFADEALKEKYQTLVTIKQLRRQDNITEASPNYILHAFRVPNDNLFRYQWNAGMMKLQQAWDVTTGSPDVTVAVIDTGVLLNHPDLRGKLVSGYDFIADSKIAMDGNGIDSNPDDPGDQSSGGSTFHGTHVAGTIGALTNNGEGVAGIGWSTKIMPLRVLGRGGAGKDYDIEQAIRYAAGLANDSGTRPSRRVDIINLSLGGPVISSGFQSLMSQVRSAGVIVTAAAGNDGTGTPIYPASLNGVISVSAVDINKERAQYSNYGTNVDITAPGGDQTPDVNGDGVPDGIISTVGDDRTGDIKFSYASSVGTSMAAPHIAGVIALMKAVNPNLSPDDFDRLLSSGKITDDLGTSGRDDYYGYGLINAQKAVTAASQTGGSTPVSSTNPQLVAHPQSLNFGVSASNLSLTLSNGGNGDLKINSITDDSQGFLTVNRSRSVDSNGLGEYVVNLDRSRLTTGTYSATITVVTNANTVKIPVILQAGATTDARSDAGHHYVLLVDPDTLEAIQESEVNAVSGVYNYRFTNVKSGYYLIIAGSDFNNNKYICDVGEACGAYLTLSDPVRVGVSDNRGQLDFSTGFNVSFSSKALMVTPVESTSPIGFKRPTSTHELPPN